MWIPGVKYVIIYRSTTYGSPGRAEKGESALRPAGAGRKVVGYGKKR